MQTSESLKTHHISGGSKGEKEGKVEEKKVSKEDQSYWEMMIDGIVRPPRAKYH